MDRGEWFGQRLLGKGAHVGVLHQQPAPGLGRCDQTIEYDLTLRDVRENGTSMDEVEMGLWQRIAYDIEL